MSRSNLSLIIFSFIFSVFTAEIGLRIFQTNLRGQTLSDSLFTPCYRDYFLIGRSFRPNSTCDWQAAGRIEINQYGFRAKKHEIKKSQDTLRIVTMGASTSHSGNYPKKLEALLEKRLNQKYRNIEVINAAVPRFQTVQSLVQLSARVLHLNPDAIIVLHAINNAELNAHHFLNNLPEVNYELYGNFWLRNSQLIVFIRNHWEKIMNARKENDWNIRITAAEHNRSQDVIPADPFVGWSESQFSNELAAMVFLAQRNKIPMFLVTMPLNHTPQASMAENMRRAGSQYQNYNILVPRVKKLNTEIRRLGKELGANVIDFEATGIGFDASKFVDLCHYTEAGGEMLAKMVADSLSIKLLN